MNIHDDYLTIFATSLDDLEDKKKEMATEGWRPYGILKRTWTRGGIDYEQPMVKLLPFPGSLKKD